MHCKLAFALLLTVFNNINVEGHGRLMEPASRSSLWRFEEYKSQHPPINYNDNELFCGGQKVQYEQNGGKCGECGDPWHDKKPRENESGGHYGRGIIARKYHAGQVFNATVELTQGHLGHFEFRLCPHNSPQRPEEETCFDKYLLQLADGSGTKYPVTHGSGFYYMQLKLPQGLTCSQCILQWHYRTGNAWGTCENGTQALGCGNQEIFRGCSDITIS